MFVTNPFELFPSAGSGMTTDVVNTSGSYRVPLGVTELFVQIWGPGIPGFTYPSPAGNGGDYVEGRMFVTPDMEIACTFLAENYTEFADNHDDDHYIRAGVGPISSLVGANLTDVVINEGGLGDGGLINQYGGGGGGAGGPTGPGGNASGITGGTGNAPGGNGGDGGSNVAANDGSNGVNPGGGGGSAYQAPNVGGAGGRSEIRITYATP